MKPIFRWWTLFLLLAGFSINAAGNSSDVPKPDSAQMALHLLNRLGYGPRPGDMARLETMGADRYIKEQLNGDKMPDSDVVAARLGSLKTLQMSPDKLWKDYGLESMRGAGGDAASRKAMHDHSHLPQAETALARIIRATDSPQQLYEVMVDFWFNHFSVYRDKGVDYLLIADYERSAIRPYAMGHFRDLLGATAKHPAMLHYLDNAMSSAPGKAGGLNENYARELMELHTLGVDGGYTQKDITELARILTGWTFDSGRHGESNTGRFYFDPSRHDDREKFFLGRYFPANGQAEGERALDILAASPATAHHLSYQLAQFFVADEPPPKLVDELTKVYLQTHGDIREMLRTLFFSSEFRSKKYMGNKFKTPYQYIISMLRAADVPVTNFQPVASALAQLGMPLYGCLTPDGYKNTESAWLNPDAMIHRIGIATMLANGSLQQRATKTPQPDKKPPDPTVLKASLSGLFTTRTLAISEAAPPQLRTALLIASPEFMHR